MEPQLDQRLHRHLPIRFDLLAEPLQGFLDEIALGRKPIEAALIFADWLEEQEDARGQAVRWSAWKYGASRTSRVHRELTPRLAAWMDQHGETLAGSLPPGVMVEWKRGLLRVRLNSSLIPAPQTGLTPELENLIDSGWVAEVVLWGTWPEQLLSRLVSRLVGVPRIELQAVPDVAIETLEALPSLRELTLTRCSGLTPFVFSSLRAHPHLERVTIDSCEVPQLSLFDLPHLRELHLHKFPRLELLQLRNLPSLESLTLSGQFHLAEWIPSEFPALRQLTLNGLRAMTRLHIQHQPSLAHLRIHNTYIMDLELRDLPSLAHLDFQGSSMGRIRLEGLSQLEDAILPKAPWLNSLEGRHLPQLKRLSIEGSGWLRSLVLEESPLLEELTVTNTRRIDLEVLGETLTKLPRLRLLKLTGHSEGPAVWFANIRRQHPQCVVLT